MYMISYIRHQIYLFHTVEFNILYIIKFQVRIYNKNRHDNHRVIAFITNTAYLFIKERSLFLLQLKKYLNQVL